MIASSVNIPAHVPPNLVGEYPLHLGATTYENPFDRIIPAIHDGPEVVYALNAYLGHAPAWVFRRARDVQEVYLDTEHFSSKDLAPFAKLLGDSWSMVPLEIDPPMHGIYRSIINPLFTPRRMAAMEDGVRKYAREYINTFKDRGHCEFMNEFAFRFPINVFLDLMGLPMEKVELFLAWEHGLLHTPDMAKVTEAARTVRDYLWSEIEKRRKNPVDDLISYGVTAEVDGRKLTDDELMGFCFNLFAGGMDTVSSNIALHFRHLAEHPEHQNYLRENPDKIPLAIEELLRAYAASTTSRLCIKPVKINGIQIMPGDQVMMPTTIVNRDPDLFDSPNEIRLDRNPRHLAFASGIHRCVGAPLARRELIIAMQEFLSAIPEFRMAPDAKVLTHLAAVVQPETLPLVWSV
jgi:cytochrome P450